MRPHEMSLTLDLLKFSSQNGKFSYGYASSPGKRSSMEDFYETRIDGVDGEIVGLFGVFDGTSAFVVRLCLHLWNAISIFPMHESISYLLGVRRLHVVMYLTISGHGGARAAEYVKQNLFSNLIRHPKFISDTKSAIG